MFVLLVITVPMLSISVFSLIIQLSSIIIVLAPISESIVLLYKVRLFAYTIFFKILLLKIKLLL